MIYVALSLLFHYASAVAEGSTDEQCDCLSQCDVDRSPDAVHGCLQIRCSYSGSLESLRATCSSSRLFRRETQKTVMSFTDGAFSPSAEKAPSIITDSDLSNLPLGTSILKLETPEPLPCSYSNKCDPIPKIVHFIFKEDISKMRFLPNPVWRESLLAWRRYFPSAQWQYKFWDDNRIDAQFKRHCPGHYKMFQSFKSNISRADLARYCILHESGGIYSDVDYEPRINFASDLEPGKVNLIQSPYKYETLQNSLMASPAGQPFWSDLLDLAHEKVKVADPTASTGPRLLDALSILHLPRNRTTTRPDVHVLPCAKFQLKTHSDKDTGKPECQTLTHNNVGQVKGIHWGTWSWYNIGQGKVYNNEIQELFLSLHHSEHSWHVGPKGKASKVRAHIS